MGPHSWWVGCFVSVRVCVECIGKLFKNRNFSSSDEPIFNSTLQAGKVVMIIDNSSSNKKKVASYRYMVKKNIV